jgi:hypothetical protein
VRACPHQSHYRILWFPLWHLTHELSLCRRAIACAKLHRSAGHRSRKQGRLFNRCAHEACEPLIGHKSQQKTLTYAVCDQASGIVLLESKSSGVHVLCLILSVFVGAESSRLLASQPSFFSLSPTSFFSHRVDFAQRVATLGPSSKHIRFQPTHTLLTSCLLRAELPVLDPSLDQRHQSLAQ